MKQVKTPKVTSRFLKDWLQAEFNRFGIKLLVKECYKTRFRSVDYEAGAAVFIWNVGLPDSLYDDQVFCHSSRGELQQALDSGKKLIWESNRGYVGDSTISYR